MRDTLLHAQGRLWDLKALGMAPSL